MSLKPAPLVCPYCGGKGEYQSASRIWPGANFAPLYICENHPKCDSYVRCHDGTDRPLGTMARARLRNLRKIAHTVFDPIWQADGNELGRSAAYAAAATVMGITGEFHIGHLDEKACEQFIERITMVEIEMDARLSAHALRGAPASEHTLEILHSLFHPDRDTFLDTVPLSHLVTYERAWTDAQRSGLVIQERYQVRLSPKGVDLVYQPTT